MLLVPFEPIRRLTASPRSIESSSSRSSSSSADEFEPASLGSGELTSEKQPRDSGRPARVRARGRREGRSRLPVCDPPPPPPPNEERPFPNEVTKDVGRLPTTMGFRFPLPAPVKAEEEEGAVPSASWEAKVAPWPASL